MQTSLGFGQDGVGWNFEKTGNPVYLHIKQTKKHVSEDRPLKKPTLLAIEYRLMGIISHMGTSTQCGHYVARIYRDGRWVILVGASIDPPKDVGYLYFFERINS